MDAPTSIHMGALSRVAENKQDSYLIKHRNTPSHKTCISTLRNNSKASGIAMFKNLRYLYKSMTRNKARNVDVCHSGSN